MGKGQIGYIINKSIKNRVRAIIRKFIKKFPLGVTILLLSKNRLNWYIADTIKSKTKNIEIIDDVICKLTTEEVDDIVLDFGSKFRKYYKNDFNAAYYQLGKYLDAMDNERNGTFSRHYVKDPIMRDALDVTLKLSTDRYAEFANKINGRNVLIIDDTVSRGQSIKEACKIIQESYAPKSITVLTLLSKLYN